MAKSIIEVTNLDKIFKLPHEKVNSIKGVVINPFSRGGNVENQHVLKDISFNVKEGEFFGIVGRNGSGKSTLLKLLAGIYSPSSGEIKVNGKLTPFIELGVGFNPELTGKENVYLNGALLGFGRKDMSAMYEKIVEFSELGRFMDQKLKNYSSGMQVRLAFSIAIQAKSDILLIDEVLAVGDAAFQAKCLRYFEELKRSKRTVVFISHDMASIKRYCDRSIAIESGKIACTGSNTEVTNFYKNLLLDGSMTVERKPWHKGTNEVIIDKVNIYNSKNKKTNKISSFEKFKIEFSYNNVTNKKKCIFGIGIFSESDVNIVGPNTSQSLKAPIVLKNNGSVVCNFEPLGITNGEYSIVISVFNEKNTIPYDFLENASTLYIADNPGYGIINDKCKWEFK